MAQRMIDLKQTKEKKFELVGIVKGLDRSDYYKDATTQSGTAYRNISFRVMYDENQSVLVRLTGYQRNVVYASCFENGKRSTERFNWSDRHNLPAGFDLIGVRVNFGPDKKNSEVLTEYDACNYLSNNLTENMPVYIRGKIERSSRMTKDGISYYTQFTPTSITEIQNEIELSEDNKHNFTETIIFKSIAPEKGTNGKATGRFIMEAYTVTYRSVEAAEYVVTNSELAMLFKKKLKPYDSIEVGGMFSTAVQIETVDEEDYWGEVNPMDQVTAPAKLEMIVKSARPSTIERGTYTEENVAEALAKIRNSQKANAQYNGNKAAKKEDDAWGEVPFDSDDESWD